MTDMTKLNTDPIFDPESQETRTAGERVYLIEDTPAVNAGAEGSYVGELHAALTSLSLGAVVDFDTPSGKPYRLTVPFAALRSLYR